MKLSPEQVEKFNRDGYLFLPQVFSLDEVDTMMSELPKIFDAAKPARILEKDDVAVRTVFGCHKTYKIFEQLSRHPRIVIPAQQMLRGDVYIHQLKINAKMAFHGDIWQWHQDYIYWRCEDGMLEPRALTAAIWLDDVNEFNGPLLLIPGSHHGGMITTPARDTAPGWLATVIADLKYILDPVDLAGLVTRNGIVAPKGPCGSVLFFHCNLVHGSVPNMSPFDRRIVFVTFNSIENRLAVMENPRPDFLADREYKQIVPVQDNILLASKSETS